MSQKKQEEILPHLQESYTIHGLQVEINYLEAIRRHASHAPAPTRIDHFASYERAREVYAVLMTGEARKYGNIILKKGVTPTP